MTLYGSLVTLRRPPAIVGQDTEPMPSVLATGGGPAPAPADLALGSGPWITWSLTDLAVGVLALALGDGPGRHRRDRHSVRRRGLWVRPTVRPLTWDQLQGGGR